MLQRLVRARPSWEALRRHLPSLFFFGGFLWDAGTLGSGSQPWDLWLLLGYSIVSAVVLVLLSRGIHLPRAEYFNWILQFCYGGTLSSLTVLYFISSDDWSSLLFVLSLTVVLVLNEFLEQRYDKLTISLTMFTLTTIMYLNFALPHVFHSVRPAWFYLGTAAGLALGFGLRRLARIEQVSFKPSLAVGAVMVVLFFFNWIPPVPLISREFAVCRNLAPKADPPAGEIEAPPFWYFWKSSESTVHLRPGERVWCWTSVYLPHGIEAQVVHNWYYDDPKQGWVRKSSVALPIRGGRQDGWRGWSYVSSIGAGTWQVRIETPNGQVIASSRFKVVPVDAGTPLRMKTITFR